MYTAFDGSTPAVATGDAEAHAIELDVAVVEPAHHVRVAERIRVGCEHVDEAGM